MTRACLLILVAAACGGAAKQPEPPTNARGSVQATPEPESCAAIAKHAVGVIASDKRAPGDETAMMTKIVETRCTEDQWTAASKTCFANAAQRAEVRKCLDGLTDEQQLALRNDEKTKMPRHVDHGSAPVQPSAPTTP